MVGENTNQEQITVIASRFLKGRSPAYRQAGLPAGLPAEGMAGKNLLEKSFVDRDCFGLSPSQLRST